MIIEDKSLLTILDGTGPTLVYHYTCKYQDRPGFGTRTTVLENCMIIIGDLTTEGLLKDYLNDTF